MRKSCNYEKAPPPESAGNDIICGIYAKIGMTDTK
jgi:hypothetical protein